MLMENVPAPKGGKALTVPNELARMEPGGRIVNKPANATSKTQKCTHETPYQLFL